MITKILFTITVVVGIMLFVRMKGSKRPEHQTSHRSAGNKAAEPSEGEKMFRQGAWLFLILMGISAIVMVVYELGSQYATVNVHVVNTQTGARVSYQAEQKNIKSNQFTTLEGRTIYIADVERIEIEPE